MSQQNLQYGDEKDYALLIACIAGGDQQALANLYSATNRLIFGLIIRILGCRDMAEEVLFDVYAQVWRQASRFDPARGGALSWMTTIARTRALDRLRAEKDYKQHDELTDTLRNRSAGNSDPEKSALASELRCRIRAALGALPPEQREVLEMSYFRGLTQTEIAESCGLPLGTVKTRTRLAMDRLRKALKHVMQSSD